MYQLLVHIYSNYRGIRILIESFIGTSLFIILSISMCIFEELVSVIMILQSSFSCLLTSILITARFYSLFYITCTLFWLLFNIMLSNNHYLPYCLQYTCTSLLNVFFCVCVCEISCFGLYPCTKFAFAHGILITFIIIYKYNTDVCLKFMKTHSHYLYNDSCRSWWMYK